MSAGETFIQVSDTHVASDSNHAKQNGNLVNWVGKSNALGSKVDLIINTGDLVDNTDLPDNIPLFFREFSKLTTDNVAISGNHDFQGTSKYNYSAYGYNLYPTIETEGFAFVGIPYININWGTVENNLASFKGSKRLVLLSHYPLSVPSNITCGGLPCVAPKWAMTSDQVSKVRNLVDKYDIEAILSGHVHTYFHTKDRSQDIDLISAGDLGLANRQNIINENNGILTSASLRVYDTPLNIVGIPRYDSVSDRGSILENSPVKVKVLSNDTITRVQYQAGSGNVWVNMTDVGNGMWQADCDWSKLSKTSVINLSAKVTTSGGTVTTITQPVKISAYYPNLQPTINPIDVNAPEVGFLVTDDKSDISKAEIFVDGVKKQTWTFAGTSSTQIIYKMDDAKLSPGLHNLKLKITDRFGRKAYSNLYQFDIGSSETPTPTPSPSPSPSPSPTPEPDPQPSCPYVGGAQKTIGLASSTDDQNTADTFIFKSSTKTEDTKAYEGNLLKVSGNYPYYKSLIRFDLSSIPQNVRIDEAKLTLTVQSWYPKDNIKPILKYALLNKAFDNASSWSNASQAETWSTIGAAGYNSDYLGPVGSHTVVWGVNTVNVTDVVKSILMDGKTNNGLLLTIDTDRMATFYSLNESGADKRPNLTVKYSCL